MATDTRTCNNQITSDADFRSWVQAWEGALLATGGMVRDTGVTGQIDPTTVTRPAANTDAGYRIYRFNDAMQSGATRPIWLKVTFGVGSGQTIPRLTFQMGETSPTAGTFSGSRIISGSAFTPATPGVGTTRSFWASGGDGRAIVCSGDISQSGSGQHFWIERLKNLSGVDTDEGVLLGFGISSMSKAVLFHSRYAQSTFSLDTGGTSTNSIWGTNQNIVIPQYGGDILCTPYIWPVAPNFRCTVGKVHALVSGAFTAASSFTATFLGASHTWMPLASNVMAGSYLGMSTGQGVMLWE